MEHNASKWVERPCSSTAAISRPYFVNRLPEPHGGPCSPDRVRLDLREAGWRACRSCCRCSNRFAKQGQAARESSPKTWEGEAARRRWSSTSCAGTPLRSCAGQGPPGFGRSSQGDTAKNIRRVDRAVRRLTEDLGPQAREPHVERARASQSGNHDRQGQHDDHRKGAVRKPEIEARVKTLRRGRSRTRTFGITTATSCRNGLAKLVGGVRRHQGLARRPRSS